MHREVSFRKTAGLHFLQCQIQVQEQEEALHMVKVLAGTQIGAPSSPGGIMQASDL